MLLLKYRHEPIPDDSDLIQWDGVLPLLDDPALVAPLLCRHCHSPACEREAMDDANYCDEHMTPNPVCPPLGYRCVCESPGDIGADGHSAACVCMPGCACDSLARDGIQWVSKRERELAIYAFQMGLVKASQSYRENYRVRTGGGAHDRR